MSIVIFVYTFAAILLVNVISTVEESANHFVVLMKENLRKNLALQRYRNAPLDDEEGTIKINKSFTSLEPKGNEGTPLQDPIPEEDDKTIKPLINEGEKENGAIDKPRNLDEFSNKGEEGNDISDSKEIIFENTGELKPRRLPDKNVSDIIRELLAMMDKSDQKKKDKNSETPGKEGDKREEMDRTILYLQYLLAKIPKSFIYIDNKVTAKGELGLVIEIEKIGNEARVSFESAQDGEQAKASSTEEVVIA